jgi:hypothetical protein
MVVVSAFAHKTAVVVSRFGTFRAPKIRQLQKKYQNKENAKDRFSRTRDDRVIVPDQGHYESSQRDQSKNLIHIKFEPFFSLKYPGEVNHKP